MRAYNKEFPFASVTYEGTNGLVSARWSRSESDFLGRNISESRPGFGGSTLITSNLYDSASRLVSTISLSTRPNPGSTLCAFAPSSEINYDLDGNMTRHGEWTYAYNSGNRLVSVVSNGITVVTMSYDTQGRRVRKVAADGTHRYFYDGWLLVYEHIVRPNSTTNEVEYVWGRDVSGTRGGLEYET